MTAAHAALMRRLATSAWLLLIASVATWPFGAARIGLVTTAIALLPLLMPLPGLLTGRRRTLQWSPLTLAPVLALALTEILVNAPARTFVSLTLMLILVAFATLIAALRSSR